MDVIIDMTVMLSIITILTDHVIQKQKSFDDFDFNSNTTRVKTKRCSHLSFLAITLTNGLNKYVRKVTSKISSHMKLSVVSLPV